MFGDEIVFLEVYIQQVSRQHDELCSRNHTKMPCTRKLINSVELIYTYVA